MIEPDFNRVRKALLLDGEPDRVPNMELWVDPPIMETFLGIPTHGELVWPDVKTQVEFWAKAGYDYAHIIPAYEFPKIRTEVGGRSWVSNKKGLITNWEEFDKYKWPDPDEIDFGPVEEAIRVMPKGMKIISGTGCGVFEETSFIMGFEVLCYSLIEDPELVEKVTERVGSILLHIVGKVAQYDGVGAIWHSDDLAYTEGTLVSPKALRKYIFPWYKMMGEICGKHDLPFIFHSDGRLWSMLDDLIDAGYNAIHPIEPLGMDIYELKNKYGNKLCLIGNIDLDYTLTRGTTEEVRTSVREHIRRLAPGGGYCCGSSNTVANYVPIKNYKAMLQAVRDYGKYPINLQERI